MLSVAVMFCPLLRCYTADGIFEAFHSAHARREFVAAVGILFLNLNRTHPQVKGVVGPVVSKALLWTFRVCTRSAHLQR